MIKERKKITKYNYKKTKSQVILEYVRTIGLSVLFSVIFTFCLALNSRNEMLKDITLTVEENNKLDKKVAQELITQTDLLKDLKTKKYSVCLHVGELYEAAGDLRNAQLAYEYAVEKSKPGTFNAQYKLLCVLVAQEKFSNAEALLENIKDYSDKKLIKFKTRSHIVIGDKYYSIGKFLSAAKNYEIANFYYNKFSKKDNIIDEAIKKRIVNAYIKTADVMVKSGLNSDALRFLNKALEYAPDDYKIKYKTAIVLADLDPEKSVAYLEELLLKIPQEIDYGIYGTALMKAATIADLDNRPTAAKNYRYKIHSIDLFVNRKVVYKNDIETNLTAFNVKKVLFTYPLKATFEFSNVSTSDIINLKGDFVLTQNDKPLETVTEVIANKNNPLFSNGYETNSVKIAFNKKIFTKKELDNYTIKIYLYKDKQYKTLVKETKIPNKSFDISK